MTQIERSSGKPRRVRSVCPHDCPSVCALDVELLDERTIGRVYGAKDHSYTQGVICAKVSRYSERIHHPERLLKPLKRIAPKRVRRSGFLDDFVEISWQEAFDDIEARWRELIDRHGPETLWPFHFAGTMGLVQRDGLDRFRRALGTSLQHSTYCTTLPDAGWLAGHGAKRGADVRDMEHSDVIVVWGGNPVNTQVNVMHHVANARRHNGAKLVVIDAYRTITADKADMALIVRPGTDGALACGVMHVLFAENLVDREYLARYTRDADRLEAHVRTRTPEWAAAITGLHSKEIVEFARLFGRTKKSFMRLGYGFARLRNGAVNLHAASCLSALTGAWQVQGGGALYGNSAIYPLDRTLIQGFDIPSDQLRVLDQSRIGEVLCGNPADLGDGPRIHSILVQNTNPAVVAPDTNRVIEGLLRDDLFTVVHEQFMTETAALADLVLPATMFLEHDDIYTASGHTHLQIGRQVLPAPGECRSNHVVMQELARRFALTHDGFEMSAWQMIDEVLVASGLPSAQVMAADGGIDLGPTHAKANFLQGFDHADKRFQFAPDWSQWGPHADGMPELPDHWDVIDGASADYPLRLVAAPARQFLNTSFTETPSARRMEKQPAAMMHPDDLSRFALSDKQEVVLSNKRGEVRLPVTAFDGVRPGTVVVESIWPNSAFVGGVGINALVSAESGKPNGGAVYHDTAIAVRAFEPDSVATVTA